jgi:hypothetical protein
MTGLSSLVKGDQGRARLTRVINPEVFNVLSRVVRLACPFRTKSDLGSLGF